MSDPSEDLDWDDPRVAAARGAEIRRAREALKMSQAVLAARANTSQQTIDRLERGAVEFSRALPEVRRVLGLEVYGPGEYKSPVLRALGRNPDGHSGMQEGRAASLLDQNRIGLFSAAGTPMKLIDAIPRAFPFEFVEGVHAFLVGTSEMEPVIRKGDIVVCNPHLPTIPGSEVAYTQSEIIKIRTLVGEDSDHWMVKSWNPEEETRVSKASLPWLDIVVVRISRNR